MASAVSQQEHLLALWASDSLAEGQGPTKSKATDGDQGDFLVKSMLSFDSDSDEESNSDQTLLQAGIAMREAGHPHKLPAHASQVLAAGFSQTLTDTSSMRSDASFFACPSDLIQTRSSQETSISDLCDLGSIFTGSCSAQESKEMSEPELKKQKLEWSDDLHACFLAAVSRLGAHKAVPSKILEAMGPVAAGMTLQDVAARLQSYRQASSQPLQATTPARAPVPLPMAATHPSPAVPVASTWPFPSLPAGVPGLPTGAPMAGHCMPTGMSAAPVESAPGGPGPGTPGAAGAPGFLLGPTGMPQLPGMLPGAFPFFPAMPPQGYAAAGFASVPGMPMAGTFPGMPYAMPMQMPNGQCWVPPAYNMQPQGPGQYMAQTPMPVPVMPQQKPPPPRLQSPLPGPVPQHQPCARVMPMIPTPGSAAHSQSLQGASPEAIQLAIAEVLDRPCQAVPPIGLKLDVPALAKQWNNVQAKPGRT